MPLGWNALGSHRMESDICMQELQMMQALGFGLERVKNF